MIEPVRVSRVACAVGLLFACHLTACDEPEAPVEQNVASEGEGESEGESAEDSCGQTVRRIESNLAALPEGFRIPPPSPATTPPEGRGAPITDPNAAVLVIQPDGTRILNEGQWSGRGFVDQAMRLPPR